MVHLYDRAAMAHALALDLNPTLLRLLKDRIGALGEELIDWTEYLVVEPGDTEADITRHVGFSPLIEPIDGKRFGEPGFQAHWDWLVDHGGWFELSVSFGSTFAYVLFIEDADEVPTDLLNLCRLYGQPNTERGK
jgi:hypothetical protein